MSDITIVVKDGCPHCKYILDHLAVISEFCNVTVKKPDELDERERKKVKAYPAIIRKGRVDYVTGNIYGIVKIVMLCVEK